MIHREYLCSNNMFAQAGYPLYIGPKMLSPDITNLRVSNLLENIWSLDVLSLL
jgi:hypothetical protein